MDKELDYGQTEERDRKKARAGKTGTYIFLTFWALSLIHIWSGGYQMILHPALLEEKKGADHDIKSSDAGKSAV